MTTLSGAHPQDDDAKHDGSDAPDLASSSDTNAATPGPNILLLEDDPNQADPLCARLTIAGYTCVSVRDIASARGELARPDRRIALMVADLNLTRSEHVAFIHETRSISHYTTLPVILATGHDSQAAREQARLLGRTDYLRKPFASATLLQLIARWTSQKP